MKGEPVTDGYQQLESTILTTGDNWMARSQTKRERFGDPTELRDALPFFRKKTRTKNASWWSVKPTGDYVADLETGKAYAREFFPLMQFNAGPASLGQIVSAMAFAGRRRRGKKAYRGIDDIALGFLMELGGNLQAAIASVAIAATAIEMPDSDLGPKFVELVKAGNALNPLGRCTLIHSPDAHIFDTRH